MKYPQPRLPPAPMFSIMQMAVIGAIALAAQYVAPMLGL